MLYRFIDIFMKFTEINYFAQLVPDNRTLQPKYLARGKNIFTAGQVGMETGAYIQYGKRTPVNINAAGAGFGYTTQYSQQRTFASAIGPENAQRFSFS